MVVAGLSSRAARAARRLAAVAVLALAAGAFAAPPKNVILMIGDGMGPDLIAAAGAYQYGKEHRAFGGDKRLAMEALQGHLYVTTFPLGKGYDFKWDDGNKEYPKRNPTDAAAAATALATGIKVADVAISMDPAKKPQKTILEIARDRGMKTGIVSSGLFCSPTPAAFAAHEERSDRFAAIAHDMLFEVKPDLIMGGGNPDVMMARAAPYVTPEDWAAVKGGATPYRLISTRQEFQGLITEPADSSLIGLFRGSGLRYRGADGSKASPSLPTLEEMTKGALATLKNDKGFFLVVDAATIDACGRANDLNNAIGEALGFDAAVVAAVAWIAENGGWGQNLLIVTASYDSGYLRGVKPAETAGTLPEVTWGTTDRQWTKRTNRLVDVFFQGAGSDTLLAYRRQAKDFERGAISYVDNIHIPAGIYYALEPPRR